MNHTPAPAPERQKGTRMEDLEMTKRKRQAEASARHRARNPRPKTTTAARIRTTNRPPTVHTMHGMSRTPEYRAWHQMRERCFNPKNNGYADYGGRGITVCAEWSAFERFYLDMGRKPSPCHSLDRKDTNERYCKDNCRWATPIEQQRNTRQTKWWVIDGIPYPGLGAASEATGLKRACLQWRFNSPHWHNYQRKATL